VKSSPRRPEEPADKEEQDSPREESPQLIKRSKEEIMQEVVSHNINPYYSIYCKLSQKKFDVTSIAVLACSWGKIIFIVNLVCYCTNRRINTIYPSHNINHYYPF
jgi:hypothetical protein